MKHPDIVFGVVGTSTTFGLGALNVGLGILAGVLTVTILSFRLRREWKHRNDPPENDL